MIRKRWHSTAALIGTLFVLSGPARADDIPVFRDPAQPIAKRVAEKIATDTVYSPAHRAQTRRVAQESIVLLSNRDYLLPLDRTHIASIAVIGPHATSILEGIHRSVRSPCLRFFLGYPPQKSTSGHKKGRV